MTVQYDPNMKGVLFPNDKQGNDRRPDYRGSAVIEGVDYNISVWVKKSKKSGDEYLSLSFEKKGEGRLTRTGQPTKPQQTQLTEDTWATADFKDDAMPF